MVKTIVQVNSAAEIKKRKTKKQNLLNLLLVTCSLSPSDRDRDSEREQKKGREKKRGERERERKRGEREKKRERKRGEREEKKREKERERERERERKTCFAVTWMPSCPKYPKHLNAFYHYDIKIKNREKRRYIFQTFRVFLVTNRNSPEDKEIKRDRKER